MAAARLTHSDWLQQVRSLATLCRKEWAPALELEVDRDRVRGWRIGQTIAWSGRSDYIAHDIETVRRLLEA